MSNHFNSPEIFFKFYAIDDCQKCKIGGINLINFNNKQIFALSPEELDNKSIPYLNHKNIYYPNGDIAFSIVEFIK